MALGSGAWCCKLMWHGFLASCFPCSLLSQVKVLGRGDCSGACRDCPYKSQHHTIAPSSEQRESAEMLWAEDNWVIKPYFHPWKLRRQREQLPYLNGTPSCLFFFPSWHKGNMDALTQIRVDCNSQGAASTSLEMKLLKEAVFSNNLFTHLYPTPKNYGFLFSLLFIVLIC